MSTTAICGAVFAAASPTWALADSSPAGSKSECAVALNVDGQHLRASRGTAAAEMKVQGSAGLVNGHLNVEGRDHQVTVWQGTSDKEVASRVAGHQQLLDQLAKESVEKASTEGDGTVDEVQPASHVVDEGLQPLAARLVDSKTGDVELTALESDGAMNVRAASADQSGRCVHVGKSESIQATMTSSAGNLSIPDAGVVQAAALPPTRVVGYRTFIPVKEADGLTCGIFLGDNRSFTSNTAASSRASVRATMNFGSRVLSTSKVIGTTHRKAARGYSAAAKTASSAGIKFVAPMIASDYGRVEVVHAVANPLCGIAGPISYDAVFEGWRDGSARIRDSARKVPAHEAYYYTGGATTGKGIFHFGVTSFLCLNLNCGSIDLDYSVR